MILSEVQFSKNPLWAGSHEVNRIPEEINISLNVLIILKLVLTFGGMWRWRRVAVARVFALVVRCRVIRLLLYSRVGKNRDTRRGSPAGAGAACTAIEGLSSLPQYSRGAEANCIYRFVSYSSCINVSIIATKSFSNELFSRLLLFILSSG